MTMRSFGPFTLALFFSISAGLLFPSCLAPSEQRDLVLDIPIDESNDSLLDFDTLIIKVYGKDSSIFQEVFHGKLTTPKGLIGLPLDRRVGRDFTVKITGYKNGVLGLHLEVRIRDMKPAGARDLPTKDTIQILPTIPEILAPSDTSISEGETLQFRIGIRNPWSSPATLILKEGHQGATLDTAGTASRFAYFTISPTHEQGRSQPYTVTIVYASAEGQIEKVMRLTIRNVNRPPRFSAIADQKVEENAPLTFKVEATDPDGDSMNFIAMDLPKGAAFVGKTFVWSPAVGQAGNYSVKFKVFDGQDSDFVAVWIAVGDVDPPPSLEFEIVSPSRDTAVNASPISIQYLVNGTRLNRQVPLEEGDNRVYLDTTVAGRHAFDTIRVTLDKSPPGAPEVKGASPVNTHTPTWNWTGGEGGYGTYRYRLDNEDMTGATLSKDTTYTASKDLDEGIHTLYVQERDEAGNWSSTGRHTIRIDTTRPPPPELTVNPTSPTKETRPTWSWKATGGDVAGLFRYKLNSKDFRSEAVETNLLSYRPVSMELGEGVHSLFVQQRDSAGNWSDPAGATISIDITPPNPPKFDTTSPLSPVGNSRPTWRWSSGGNGGSGHFRFKLDNGDYSSYSADTSHQPPTLNDGPHTLYVQERDSVGNESIESSRRLFVTNRGPVGFSLTTGGVNHISSAYSPSGILHVAFSESVNGETMGTGKVVTYRNGWAVLGNASFSDSRTTENSISFNGDTIYIAYVERREDESGINILRVKKFRDGTWIPVGDTLDAGSPSYISMAMSQDGIPYVIWFSFMKDKIRIARFNRSKSKWEDAGDQDIGMGGLAYGRKSIAFNASNQVHIAYGGRPTVKRLIGNQWVQAIEHPKSGEKVELAFHGDTPYLTFTGAEGVATLIRYSSSWLPEEESTLSGTEARLALSPDGIPFMAYYGNSYDDLSVASLIGTKLMPFGYSPGKAEPYEANFSMAISPLGIPHLSFRDSKQSFTLSVHTIGYDP